MCSGPFHASLLLVLTTLTPAPSMQPAVLPRGVACLYLVAIATCSFLAQLLLNRAFQIETAVRASAANYTQVLWANLLGVLLFREPLTLLGCVGAALVAVGVLAVAADKKKAVQERALPAAAGLKAKSSFRSGPDDSTAIDVDEEAAGDSGGRASQVQLSEGSP